LLSGIFLKIPHQFLNGILFLCIINGGHARVFQSIVFNWTGASIKIQCELFFAKFPSARHKHHGNFSVIFKALNVEVLGGRRWSGGFFDSTRVPFVSFSNAPWHPNPTPPLDPCRLSIEWLPMQICSLAAKRLAVYIYELSFTS